MNFALGLGIVAIAVFYYMNQRQRIRHAQRRARMQERQDTLFQQLSAGRVGDVDDAD